MDQLDEDHPNLNEVSSPGQWMPGTVDNMLGTLWHWHQELQWGPAPD